MTCPQGEDHGKMSEFNRLALLVSDAPRAQEAAADEFRAVADWVPLEEADAVVVLGGDGFALRNAAVLGFSALRVAVGHANVALLLCGLANVQ